MLHQCGSKGSLVLLGCVASLLASCEAPSATYDADDGAVAITTQGLNASDCPAGYTLIQGTNNAETLIGTPGNDCLFGWGGNDTVWGRGGNDYIAGGNGNDTIHGEEGNDQLFGESNPDTIYGGDGNDTINGGAHDDTVHGGNGNDVIEGEGGSDILNGDADNDTLRGGDAIDTIHGGAGDDLIHGDGGNDILYGDDGDDVIDGDAANDTISGGAGDDIIYGDVNNDTLTGDAGDDALIGGAGTNTSNGGTGNDSCTGVSCEFPVMTLSGCTQDSQCSSGQRCIVDFGLCIGCVSNQDGDALCDSKDGCPTDAAKGAPGACGCGVADTDSDADGTADCNDGCPNDASKIAAGICGCGVSDVDSDSDGTADCNDGCPADAAKTAAGICGCGVSDTDSDSDGTADCIDGCPSDAAKVAAGICGCGVSDVDTDLDGTADCLDGCPSDAAKVAAGICGCGISDADSDSDGTADCNDGCPADAGKIVAGICGCGVSDVDTDSDGTADCNDDCPSDANKTAAGVCGCGVSDVDGDGDGVSDCIDVCEGFDDNADADEDGIPDGCDEPDVVSCAFGAPLLSDARATALGHFNGDSYLDALVLSAPAKVWLNNGTGTFSQYSTLSTGFGATPIRVATGDMDSDGKLDALIGFGSGLSGSGPQMYYGDGAGNFSLHTTLPGRDSTIALGRINTDNGLDLASAGVAIEVRLGATPPARGHTGIFGSVPFPGQSLANSIAMANFNQADTTDEVIASDPSGNTLYVDFAADGSVASQTHFPVGGILAIGDLDANGTLDVVLATTNLLRVYLGDGAGGLTAADTTSTTWGTPLDADVFDLDDDGVKELIVLTASDLHIRSYAPGFAEVQQIPVTGGSSASAGDLNGDGIGDIVIARSLPASSSLILLCE